MQATGSSSSNGGAVSPNERLREIQATVMAENGFKRLSTRSETGEKLMTFIPSANRMYRQWLLSPAYNIASRYTLHVVVLHKASCLQCEGIRRILDDVGTSAHKSIVTHAALFVLLHNQGVQMVLTLLRLQQAAAHMLLTHLL